MNCKYIIQKYVYGGWVDLIGFRSELSAKVELQKLRNDFPKSNFKMVGVFSFNYE